MSKNQRRWKKKKKQNLVNKIIALNSFFIALSLFVFMGFKMSNNQLSSSDLPTDPLPISYGFVLLSWFGLQGIVILIFSYFNRQKRLKEKHKLRVSGIQKIDHMTGQQFEDYLTVYFEDLGYRVEDTGGRGDRGADKILIEPVSNKRICVQAKCWNKNVTFDAVQQVFTAKTLWNCDEAWIITNRDFTKQVRESAQQLQIQLWDREKLTSKMYAYNDRKAQIGSHSVYYALNLSSVFHDLSCEHGRNIAKTQNVITYSNYEEAISTGKKKCSCYK